MDSRAVALLVIGGVALWYFTSSSAQAAAPPTESGAMPPDSGGFDLASLFNWVSPTTAAPDTTAPAADTTSAPTPVATSTSNWSSLFDLGSIFGLTSPAPVTSPDQINMTASWKTGSYPQFAVLIANVEASNAIPTDLLARLLYQESHYRGDIITCQTASSAGALGIAQFMPATAAQFGIDPCDPTQAIPAAGKYLASLYRQFGDWTLALMAYNWGPGNVQKYINSGYTNTVPTETQNYVAQITADVAVA